MLRMTIKKVKDQRSKIKKIMTEKNQKSKKILLRFFAKLRMTSSSIVILNEVKDPMSSK